MGAAAYKRGSRCISQQISREARSSGFELIDQLNAVPKHANARRPFGPVLFKYDGRNWWALDPVKQFSGFGFWYDSLREAVAAFHVTIVAHNEIERTFTGELS